MIDNTIDTKEQILQSTTELFAQGGYDGISMRKIALLSGIAPSVLYYYFKNKHVLLKEMFNKNNTLLGKDRNTLPQAKSASQMIEQRIRFQLDHAEQIVAILKYFLTYRSKFNKLPNNGYIPEKGYFHIEEALRYGVQTGEFANREIEEQAKVITHAINGFLLEYYPNIPKDEEKQALITTIHKFIMRSVLRV